MKLCFCDAMLTDIKSNGGRWHENNKTVDELINTALNDCVE
jgi:hypothetical protein